jgi:hypothetical protein
LSPRIGIVETLITAVRLVGDRIGEIFRVGLILVLGLFGIGIFLLNYVLPLMHMPVAQAGGAAADQPMLDPRLLPALLLVLVVEFLFVSVFAVGWNRLILMGVRAGSGLGIAFGRREIAYLGRLWLCFVGAFAGALVCGIVETFLAGVLRANPVGFVPIGMAGFTLLAGYVLGRIGLSFAALSIDQPASFALSWEATRGQGAYILAIYGLVAIGWLILGFLLTWAEILGLGAAAPYALLFIHAVLSAVFLALLVTINAVLYRRLSGWRPS